ncbi:MAG: AIR synthase related protein [Candidatus Altiarchaeota archaeon]
MKGKDAVEKYVTSIEWIRDELSVMDELAGPIMGVSDWDDAVCISFGGKRLVASVDGPYAKRLVLKSALIHASTDVVVKGAKPLFALDTVMGTKKDVEEMIDSLKKQALAMKIPILGGNTLFEETEPRASLTVLGELVVDEPIRDSTACKGDTLALVGEPIWGEQEERIKKALNLFECWFSALASGIQINSAKDVTKGGLASVVYEMASKSGNKFRLKERINYPLTRNLDNFIVTASRQEYAKLESLCKKKKCLIEEIGTVK